MPETDITIGLGFGSNIGARAQNIEMAKRLIEERGIARILSMSSLYRTPPWGFAEQEDFANACALAVTRLDPHDLLAALKQIEHDMGRRQTLRWGPRLIDIDILFYGTENRDEPDLVLPHKELFNRPFVLLPLAEIAPNLRITGRSVSEAAAQADDSGITLWNAKIRVDNDISDAMPDSLNPRFAAKS